jgi:hypothetical protein
MLKFILTKEKREKVREMLAERGGNPKALTAITSQR